MRACVADALGGAGSGLLIEAPAGLGKSRLLDCAADIAAESGATVLGVRAAELEQALSWGVARGLLGDAAFGRAVEAATRDATAEDAAFTIQHALLGALAERAHAGPVVLVADDLHWCDEPSLRFLLYVQHRLATMAVGLVAAARPDEPAGRELLAALGTGPRTRTLELKPLHPASVAVLVRDTGAVPATDEICAACARVTAGNPFYLHELLRELAGRDGDDLGAEAIEGFAPGSVRRAIERRLTARGEAATRLARAVAVLGDRVPLVRAAALAGLAPDAAIAAADDLARADVLAPGQPLEFVHPLVRAVVHAAIPPARRNAGHRRAAALLADEPGGADVAATHLLHTGPAGEPWAAAVLAAAGRRALERGAPAAAARLLARALEEPPPEADRAGLLVDLGRAEAATGSPDAVERLTAAVELTAGAEERARVLLLLGWVEHHLGRFGQAAATFDRGLATLGAHDPELAAMLQAGFFTAGSLAAGDAAEAHARARDLQEAPPGADGPARRALLARVLTARVFAGDPVAELTPLAERAWSGDRALEEDGPHSETVWAVIGFDLWSDRYAEAERRIERALVAARGRGSSLASARGWYARGWLRYWTGDLAGAVADQRRAIGVWRGGMELYLPAATYWLALALLEAGDTDAAADALPAAGPPERWADTALGVFLVAVDGLLAHARGDARTALERHVACGELAVGRLGARNPALLPWRSQAAIAALELGDIDLARRQAADALAAAERYGAPRALGAAQRVAGLAAGGRDGLALLERSVATLAPTGAPVEHARALIDLGAAIRRAGRRAEARRPLREGLALARRHGAAPLATLAETELAASGVRPPGQADGALTPSELRVAQLAAAGRTNRQIAGSLRISVKAVEWHLHQTYRKLGVGGRRELAAALEAEMRPGENLDSAE